MIMDSLTHSALGAVLGDAILGKKMGNRAMVWGAIAGNLPDLDIVLRPFEDDLSFLVHHRGLSHSIFVAVIVAPMLAWLVAAWGRKAARREASRPPDPPPTVWHGNAIFLAGILSHLFLDACTAFGTPLLMPWSDHRFALNNLFVIDPLFTLPLVVAAVACLRLGRDSRKRRIVRRVGLGLSGFYLALTLIVGHWVQGVFAASLAEQRIESRRLMAAPTPFNSVLWYCVSEGPQGYHVGYYSVFSPRRPIRFHYVPRNGDLLDGLQASLVVKRLMWFSNGYYAVRRQGEDLVFDVLKFGMLTPEANDRPVAFSFVLRVETDGAVSVTNVARPQDVRWSKLLAAIWQKIRGRDWTSACDLDPRRGTGVPAVSQAASETPVPRGVEGRVARRGASARRVSTAPASADPASDWPRRRSRTPLVQGPTAACASA